MDGTLISIAACLVQLHFFNVGYVNAEATESSFKCEDDGNYPLMDDCNGYYECKNGVLTHKDCPSKTEYDPQKQKCMRFYKRSNCRRPDCSNDTLQFVPHPGSHKVYIQCFNKSPKSMNVCPGDTVYSQSSTPPCEKPCKGHGFFPNKENPIVYYRCTEIAGKLRNLGFYCPENFKLKELKMGVMCIKNTN